MEGTPARSVFLPASWRLPLFVFLLAATVRVLFALHPTTDAVTDSVFYSKLAEHIRSGNILLRGKDPFFNPGYPYWLALWRAVGFSPLGVRILQGLVAALALAALAARLRRRHRPAWALAVGVLLACAPTFAAHETEFLGESLALPLIVILLWRFDRLEDGPSTRRAAALGLACGCAALFRPNLIFGAGLVAAVFAGQAARKKRTPLFAAAFLIGVGFLPTLWMARNMALGQGFQAFSAHGGYILYLGNHAGAPGTVTVPPGTHLANADTLYVQSREVASHRLGKDLAPGEADRYWYGQVVRFWFLQPVQATALMWKKARLLVSNIDLGDVLLLSSYDTLSNPFAALPILDGFLIALGLLGLCLAKDFSLYRLWALGTTVSVIVYFVTSRQRMWDIAALAPLLPEVARLFPVRASDPWRLWGVRATALGILAMPLVPPRVSVVDTAAIDRGRGMIRQDRPAEALRLLEEKPLPVAAYWYTRGMALERLDRKAEAREAYLTAIGIDAKDIASLFRLGHLAQEGGDLASAREWYQRVLSVDGQNPHALLQTARIEMTEGRALEAVRLLEAARNVLPQSIDIRRHLGFAYLAAERWNESEKEFEDLLSAHPDDAESRMGLDHARTRNRDIRPPGNPNP